MRRQRGWLRRSMRQAFDKIYSLQSPSRTPLGDLSVFEPADFLDAREAPSVTLLYWRRLTSRRFPGLIVLLPPVLHKCLRCCYHTFNWFLSPLKNLTMKKNDLKPLLAAPSKPCMFEVMLTSRLLSADVCGTVMDSLSLQMAQAAVAHARTPQQMLAARQQLMSAKARQVAERMEYQCF
jgi:hypothetical protein